jgi:hypothetical protein
MLEWSQSELRSPVAWLAWLNVKKTERYFTEAPSYQVFCIECPIKTDAPSLDSKTGLFAV